MTSSWREQIDNLIVLWERGLTVDEFCVKAHRIQTDKLLVEQEERRSRMTPEEREEYWRGYDERPWTYRPGCCI